MAHDFNYAILDHVAHRPSSLPMPDRPWVMTQTWNDLLFAHWVIDAALLRVRVPRHFELDLFEGKAWIAVVPFHMTNVGVRGLPAVPGLSAFPELNVRTYVRVGDKPGVYFFSLDADSRLAVKGARILLNMPYYAATMTVAARAGRVDYSSRRRTGRPAELVGSYGPTGSPSHPVEGSLEYFLTERYCLYNVNRRGRPFRLDIHHPPWPLQPAEATFTRNTMTDAAGLPLPLEPPLLHFSTRQDVVAWPPVRV